MVIIGIDPGLTGGWAILDHNGLRAVGDIPTKPLPNLGPKAMVKRQVDGRALVEELRLHLDAKDNGKVVMEDVQAIGGSAIQTMGSMMHSKGVIDGALSAKGFEITLVRPQEWKKMFGLTKDKAKCRSCCLGLYPTAPVTKAKDHNKAEAILIAHYGYRKYA